MSPLSAQQKQIPWGIDLLEEALRIQSLTGQEHNLAEFLRGVMEAKGFEAYVDGSGSAIGILGQGKRQLVMMGHMDTVPGIVPVRRENGCLYGRGAVDAKGPLCGFVLAAAALKEVIEASDWQVVVIGATEEESAYSKGANHAASRFRPELCIIGEPSSSGGITLGYKGRLLIEGDFSRGSQHTAAPGPSVTETALKLWDQIKGVAEKFNEGREKVFDHILPSLRRVSSSDSGLVEECRLVIGLRLPLDYSPFEAENMVRAWVNQARRDGTLPETVSSTIRFIGHESAYKSTRDSLLARSLVAAIREEGIRPAFKNKTGTADFNVVGPIWNCPMVAYGPGDSSLDHTPHEHVPIEEFERGVRVLTRALEMIVRS